MTVTVKIPTQLRSLVGEAPSVAAEGETVREVLESLFEAHGELRDRIYAEDGDLRRFVNVYIGGEDIRYLEGLDTPVPAGGELTILPAVAGG
jgi:molybdopterin synthase sulfur carrier subunit